MKQQYRYNPQTCQYEPIFISARQRLKSMLMYVILGFIIASYGVYWYIDRYDSLQEQKLILENTRLTKRWLNMEVQLNKLTAQLDSLNKKDDHHYRALLNMPVLSPEEREAGTGGNDRSITEAEHISLIRENYTRILKLKNQLLVAQQSFNQLEEATRMKNSMMASRPAIQPVSSRDLTTLHLTFGTRLHPIFNKYMDHKGLDFSARYGTPVYATADGRVSTAHFSDSYGNVVYIDHGFGYETRYAHLQKFAVQAGNFVKRGEVIGYVGNTGVSVAPHLHYEIYLKGKPLNPIYFFQRDLHPSEYQKIIQPARSKG